MTTTETAANKRKPRTTNEALICQARISSGRITNWDWWDCSCFTSTPTLLETCLPLRLRFPKLLFQRVNRQTRYAWIHARKITTGARCFYSAWILSLRWRATSTQTIELLGSFSTFVKGVISDHFSMHMPFWMWVECSSSSSSSSR